MDALQGVAYATDAQITELTARRLDDPRNARMIVTVRRALSPTLTDTDR